MGSLIKVINDGFHSAAAGAERHWLPLGGTLAVGGFLFGLQRERAEEVDRLILDIRNPGSGEVGFFQVPRPFVFSRAGIKTAAVPRAVERDEAGRPVRLLLEFAPIGTVSERGIRP